MQPITDERLISFLETTLHWHRGQWDAELISEGTNKNYKATYEGKAYAIRLGSPNAAILSIHRDAEEEALKVVSDLGCGAKLVYFDKASGNMVTEFLESRPIGTKDYEDPVFLKALLHTLKKIHRQKIHYDFDPLRDIEEKLASMRAHHIPAHPDMDKLLKYYYQLVLPRRSIEKGGPHYGLCHGDPWPSNMLYPKDGRLLLIDYEYAGNCDVFYDLACIAGKWEGERLDAFLTLYFGESTPALVQKMRDWDFIVTLWNGTWAYLKSLEKNSTGFDYVDYGHRHMNIILERFQLS